MTTRTEASPTPVSGARTESFKEEVRALKIKDPNASRDGVFLRLGLALMVIGIAISVIGFFVSHNTSNTLTQNDALTLAVIGVAVTIAGAAVFLRYSLASFMRFWLARFIFETRNRD
jgi:hypothetical protein